MRKVEKQTELISTLLFNLGNDLGEGYISFLFNWENGWELTTSVLHSFLIQSFLFFLVFSFFVM